MPNGSDRVEVLSDIQRRRRYSLDQKLAVLQAAQPGMTISYVARRHGVAPSLIFGWRRRMSEGGKEAVRADDEVVAKAARAGKQEDQDLLVELRALVDARPTYGYRRLTALLNRARRKAGLASVNHKRIYRLMSQHGLRCYSVHGATSRSRSRWRHSHDPFQCVLDL